MALVSPGVEVTIIDQSQYLPAPTNSIPLIVLATAQNKADPTSTAVAAGTTAANAGKLFQITSQRDLVTLYGNPFFYTTSTGTPIQGYELNEYGLLAAYSALGVTNRAFCLRADIDLASLVGQTGRPTGAVADGTWWLDTTTSTWGIYEFNAVTGEYVLQTPIVITDAANVVGGVPLASIGSIGDYAVNAIPTYDFSTASTSGQFFYKDNSNSWTRIGSAAWRSSSPTIQGSNSNPTLTAGDEFFISINGGEAYPITVPASPNNVVAIIAQTINDLGFTYLSASVVGGKLQIFSQQTGVSDIGSTIPPYLEITASGVVGDTVLGDLGITAGTYNQLGFAYGTSAQQPLWQSGQTYPRPTGSVWIKVGTAGNGLNTVISQWSATTATWNAKTVSYAINDWEATAAIDATGGKAIPAGTVYTQYNFDAYYTNSGSIAPLYYWERIAQGATIITGSDTTPSFTNGPYTSLVNVSIPGSTNLSSGYQLTVSDNADATGFVTSWAGAGIPFTTATVLSTGEIQISHTEGGIIIVNDTMSNGFSNGLMADAGFIVGTTQGVKEGYPATHVFTPTEFSSTGSGSGLEINVVSYEQDYNVQTLNFVSGGTNYVVGELVTFDGRDLGGTTPANDLVVVVTAIDAITTEVTAIEYVSGTAAASYTTQLSNWQEFEMTANEGAPVASPDDLTNWFYSVVDEVDIMVNTTAGWRGYRNVNYNSSGFPLPSGSNTTDPNGPLVSASEPTVQSDGTPLVYGDIWIDTSDLENYPIINRWQSVNAKDIWVVIDNTDQTSPTGVVFADARWSSNQDTINPANDPIPTIKSLLLSNNLDLDAPDNTIYPVGMLLFNTRRSGYNVKQYRSNYFNNVRFPDTTTPDITDTWLSVSGLQTNGAPYMGRKAQRAMVVKAMRAVIDTNSAIRDEDNAFNLIATPNYPELQPNMVVLNNDRGTTGFIVGDTPMRLADNATEIQAWATNAAGAASTGEDGLVTRDSYMGLFYPSGITSDLSGNLVAVPASHMMLRTILRNDTVAYPWFAPAGTRRGLIDNATNIGYVSEVTGEFIAIKTNIGIRDVLYTNQINPMVFFTGNGLLNYGNKTSFNSSSALDRVNVARLVAYIRRQLTLAARPFVFEPNDSLTRQQIQGVIQSLFVDLVAKRGVYDFLVVCDDSNNTPARIDRNELWVDVAIEPVKAVEFIYIPVRILNTGELGNQA